MTGAKTQTYSYDGWGNLYSRTGDGSNFTLGVDPANNRLFGGEICYDPNGNMTGTDGCSQNEFDMSNRLVRVAVTSSGAVDISGHMDLSREIYVYTADNKRVTTVRPNGNNNQVFYIYGAKNELGMVCSSQFFGNTPVCETGGPRDVKFVGRLVRQNGAPVTVDRVGSVVANPLNRYARYFGPYGDKIAETVNNPVYPGNFEFASYLFDVSTGWNYADQRYYSSTYARFMSADRYRASAGAEDPGSWNRYAYTRGDPINRYDPLGLFDQVVSSHTGNTNCEQTKVGCTGSDKGERSSDGSKPDSDQGHGGGAGGRKTPAGGPCPPLPALPSNIPTDQVQQNITDAKDYFGKRFDDDPETAVLSLLGYLTAKFQEGGDWDYKKNYRPFTADRTNAQNFGNFDFGAVLESLDFSYYFTQNAAGVAQIAICAKGGACGSGIPGVMFPYGDQLSDAIYVRKGFDYETAKRADCK